MENLNTKYTKLTMDHYNNNDPESQLHEISNFELLNSSDPAFEEIKPHLFLMKADSLERAGKLNEALKVLEGIISANSSNMDSFYTQLIAQILMKLNRMSDAVQKIEDRLLLESKPNYILDLLYWYASNIEGAKNQLDRFQQQVLQVINELDVNLPENNIEIIDQIIFLKNERQAADRRYNTQMGEIRNLSNEAKLEAVNHYILNEPVGYFRRMASDVLLNLKQS